MSSYYYAYCVSHNPAIEIADAGNGPEARRRIEGMARDGFPGHEKCKVILVRSSGAPMELCHITNGGESSIFQWVDIDWIRLLAFVRDGYLPERTNLMESYTLKDWKPGVIDSLREVLQMVRKD